MNKDERFEIMKEMKSPCNDGWSVEFYYIFLPVLGGGGMVVEALNETFDNEKMSNSQRQGVN